MPKPRVRFAPSPTGYLHIGGARTALFNWLWTRRFQGAFVLRIEDTDRDRNREDSVDAIVESLQWLGLDWDEGPRVGGDRGPYFQGERLPLYQEYADKLIQSGHAYRCFCTTEELQAARRAHESSGSRDAFRYPGTCRDRTDSPDRPYSIRFRAPLQGSVAWEDVVKGPIEVRNDTHQDFILLRANGIPLYNFGCVVDDLTMDITLIGRGEEHMINTAPQILLHRALGHEPPIFAHVPMILSPGGEKLSKRHAAVSVLEYRDMGYLPDAVVNYLVRLGWSHGDQEIFTRAELIEKFDWSQVGRTAARYDPKKFIYVQAEHLRSSPMGDLTRLVLPFLEARGLVVSSNDERLPKAVSSVLVRATTLVEIAEMIDYVFRAELVIEPEARAKFLRQNTAEILSGLAESIRDVAPFERTALESKVTSWLDTKGLKLGEVAQPARVALTGRAKSPGLFEVMEVLGHETVVHRLEEGARIAAMAA